jgi:hypothetical protein
MTTHHLDRSARDRAVEQSLVAAIEINEVIRNLRSDAPGLLTLITMLLGHPDKDHGNLRRDLLANSQLASLSFRAATSSGQLHGSKPELERILGLLLQVSQLGLDKFSRDDLVVIRDFALGLNRVLVEEISARIAEPPLARSRPMPLVSVE